ncbi:hypothetical protein [Streptomyces sp. NPDC054866]
MLIEALCWSPWEQVTEEISDVVPETSFEDLADGVAAVTPDVAEGRVE